jgi:hypothetical protein
MSGIAWLGLALLGVAVKVVLFPRHRGGGAMAVVWAVVFGLFLWWGSHQVGLDQTRAILLGLVGGAASGFYIYMRGSAVEGAPAGRPGAFLGRRIRRGRMEDEPEARRSRRTPNPTPGMRSISTTRELVRARNALDRGRLADALFQLREARKVAVAQRKLDELLEVRELVDSVSARSSGRVKAKSERLAQQVGEGLRGFPADELAAVGIEPEPDPLGPALARWGASAREHGPARTRELTRARGALDQDRFSAALFELRMAQRVAVAQRRPDELLAVQELAQVVSERSEGRTRARSEELTRKVEADLRSLAQAGDV